MAKFRKLIALLLVVVMSFSLLGVTGVFADTETEQSSNTYVCPTCGAELTAPDADEYYVCTQTASEHTDLTCPEHEHTDACYEHECDAECVPHTHTAACYASSTQPCSYSHRGADGRTYTHDDGRVCTKSRGTWYYTVTALTCDKVEGEDYDSHSDNKELTCDIESDHVHKAACYTTTPATYSHELKSYSDNSATVTAGTWITNKDLYVPQSLSVTGRAAASSELAASSITAGGYSYIFYRALVNSTSDKNDFYTQDYEVANYFKLDSDGNVMYSTDGASWSALGSKTVRLYYLQVSDLYSQVTIAVEDWYAATAGEIFWENESFLKTMTFNLIDEATEKQLATKTVYYHSTHAGTVVRVTENLDQDYEITKVGVNGNAPVQYSGQAVSAPLTGLKNGTVDIYIAAKTANISINYFDSMTNDVIHEPRGINVANSFDLSTCVANGDLTVENITDTSNISWPVKLIIANYTYSSAAVDGTNLNLYYTQNPTPVSGTMDFTFTKSWSDNNDAASARPASISVTLAGPVGTAIPNATKTVTAADGWTCTWKDLPVASYTVSEEPVPNYTAGAASYTTGSATSGIIYHSCNNKTYKNLSGNFIVAKLTGNKGFIIWTPTELTTDAEKAEYKAAAAKFFSDIEGKTVTYQSGTVTGDPAITTGTTGSTGVTLVFGKTSTWAQFAVGTTTKVNTAATITNTYAPPAPTTFELTVTKTVAFTEGSAEVAVPDSFTFNVYAVDANGAKTGSSLGTIVANKAADGGYASDKAISLPAGDYWLEETTGTVPSGYTLDVEKNGAFAMAAEAKTIAVTNTYTQSFGDEIVNPATLTVTKVDGNNAPLAGAGFTVYSDEGCSTVSLGEQITTKDNNSVTFTFSQAGTFYLKETTVPEGYNGGSTIWQISVAKSGDYTVSQIDGNVFHKVYNWLISAVPGLAASNQQTLTVTNTAKTVYYYRIDRVYTTTTDGVAASETVTGTGRDLISSYESSFTVGTDRINAYPAADGRTGFVYTTGTTTATGSTTQSDPAVITLNYSKTVNNSYNITYYLDGVKQGESDAYVYGASVAGRAVPTKTGNTVTGWYDKTPAAGSTVSVVTTMPAQNLNYYAFSSVNSYAYTIHHVEKNNVSHKLADDTTGSAAFGSTVELAGYVKTNITGFAYDSKDADIVIDTESNTATIYYAPVNYNVTYTVTGTAPDGFTTGAQDALKQTDKHMGDSITVADAYTATSATGTWVFHGWNAPEGVTVSEGKFTMPAKDVELTGSWSFTANGSGSLTINYFDAKGYDATAHTGTVLAESVTTSAVGGTTYNVTSTYAKTVDKYTQSDVKGSLTGSYVTDGVTYIDVLYTRDTGMLIVHKTFNDSVFTPAEVTVTVTGPDGYNKEVTLNKGNGWTWEDRVPTGEYTVLETKNGATGYYTCVTSYLDGDMGENANTTDGKVTVSNTAAVMTMAVADVPGAWVTITNTYTYNPPYIPDPPTPTPTPTPSEEPTPTPTPSVPPEEDLGDEDVPLGPGPEEDLGEDEVPMDAAPQTGDSSNAALMWLLLCASFSGLVVLAATSPKRKHSEDK